MKRYVAEGCRRRYACRVKVGEVLWLLVLDSARSIGGRDQRRHGKQGRRSRMRLEGGWKRTGWALDLCLTWCHVRSLTINAKTFCVHVQILTKNMNSINQAIIMQGPTGPEAATFVIFAAQIYN